MNILQLIDISDFLHSRYIIFIEVQLLILLLTFLCAKRYRYCRSDLYKLIYIISIFISIFIMGFGLMHSIVELNSYIFIGRGVFDDKIILDGNSFLMWFIIYQCIYLFFYVLSLWGLFAKYYNSTR